MRKNVIIGMAAAVSVLVFAGSSWAANHVRIDRIEVLPNSTSVTVGVYVDNDVPITGFVLPLEIRTWSGNAYIVAGTFTRGINSAGRMNASPLGAADDGGQWPAASLTNRTIAVTEPPPLPNSCKRRIVDDMGNTWNTNAALPDYVSPDAVFFATVSTGDPQIGELIAMPAGADAEGTPSYRIICNIGPNQGVFIIDTTCIAPANHLAFVNEGGFYVIPTFEHGIVGVGVPAGVREVGTNVVPESYALDQNYPNPFNAGTVIRFAQPVDGKVKMDVYDILGRKVITLVDEFRSAGVHQVNWDGRSEDGVDAATGVYFYRITTEGYSSTRKMVLLK